VFGDSGLPAMRRYGTRGIFGVAAFTAILAVLHHLFERREYRRKAALVRADLGTRRCSRCDGDLGAWGGRFERGDIHFNPGSYLPRISVSCDRCHAQQVFYVRWDGRLFNRDTILGRPPPDGLDA
jgi:hypothetical protein